jgi:hypothetical protein
MVKMQIQNELRAKTAMVESFPKEVAVFHVRLAKQGNIVVVVAVVAPVHALYVVMEKLKGP